MTGWWLRRRRAPHTALPILLLLLTAARTGLANFPMRIPIGALFDEENPQTRTAFRHEFEKHNNSTESQHFKLNIRERSIPTSDPYTVTKAMCGIMAGGVFSFFGFTNTSMLSSVCSYTAKFNMPYMTASAPSKQSSLNYSYMLHLRPTYDKAMLDVMKHYKWANIFYIYDNEDGLARLQRLTQLVNEKAVKLTVASTRLINIDNCYALLRNLDSRPPSGDKYIVLDLSTERALQVVLKQIQNVGMNRRSYHYLLGGLIMDELNLEDFKHGGMNITGFRLVNPESHIVQRVQRDWARLNPTVWQGAGANKKFKLDAALTMDAVTVIVKTLTAMLNTDPEVWREVFRRGQVFNNNTRGVPCDIDQIWLQGASLRKNFKKVRFEGVTGHVAFDDRGYRTDYNMDVLELGLNSEVNKIGSWSYQSGLSVTPRETPKDPNEHETVNTSRVITTIESAPYMMYRKKPEEGEPLVGNDQFEGYCCDLAKMIGEECEFNYALKLVADNKYGKRDENGTWDGMVGELTSKKADLAVAPLTISSMRERVIDFSKPFMRLGISIMIKKPEKQKPGVFSFMDPLSYEIWMCIIIAYLGVSVVLFLVSRFSPYEWQIEDSINGPTFTNDFTLLNSLWFSLGAFMRQGCDVSPRSLSGRIVGSVWWFFTLILISSYTANLAAFLTVERMLTPIESADDLAKQTTIQYGTLSSGSTQTFFMTSKIAVYERMWNFMSGAKPSVFVDSTQMGVARVRDSKGKYAFLLESTMNDYHNQRKPCNTMKVGGNLDSKGYGIATPLGSDLREKISLAVLTLRERGDLQKLHKKWWYDKGECAAEAEGKGSAQSALTLSNVAGIFYILIGGLGVAMVVSLLEFLYKSKVEARRQKKALASSFRSKSRPSIRATPERENGGVGENDVHKSMSTVPIARSSAVSLV